SDSGLQNPSGSSGSRQNSLGGGSSIPIRLEARRQKQSRLHRCAPLLFLAGEALARPHLQAGSPMKICLVTAFPPSRQGLNEYGYHIARELNQHPGLTLTILGDDLPHSEPELPDFQVIRCWGFNKLSNPVRLSHAITQSKPDVAWINIGLATSG